MRSAARRPHNGETGGVLATRNNDGLELDRKPVEDGNSRFTGEPAAKGHMETNMRICGTDPFSVCHYDYKTTVMLVRRRICFMKPDVSDRLKGCCKN